MYGLRSGKQRRRNDLVSIQVRLRWRTTSQIHRFICHAHVLRLPIRIGINRNGVDTQRFGGAYHSTGNFTSISNQNFFQT
ncbi:MAG: hypothetical protein CM15mP120_29520 [Pseudomonadota bacterium]|nr:MAG: hypothetical protein CM15mP120_29520 [Pseudomonadota bacterium]